MSLKLYYWSFYNFFLFETIHLFGHIYLSIRFAESWHGLNIPRNINTRWVTAFRSQFTHSYIIFIVGRKVLRNFPSSFLSRWNFVCVVDNTIKSPGQFVKSFGYRFVHVYFFLYQVHVMYFMQRKKKFKNCT